MNENSVAIPSATATQSFQPVEKTSELKQKSSEQRTREAIHKAAFRRFDELREEGREARNIGQNIVVLITFGNLMFTLGGGNKNDQSLTSAAGITFITTMGVLLVLACACKLRTMKTLKDRVDILAQLKKDQETILASKKTNESSQESHSDSTKPLEKVSVESSSSSSYLSSEELV